jgi:hypothetical protein
MWTNMKNGKNPITKLTVVCINGRPILANVPCDENGKVRLSRGELESLASQVGIPPGSCIGPY